MRKVSTFLLPTLYLLVAAIAPLPSCEQSPAMITPGQRQRRQWPRGPMNDLHTAAHLGSVGGTKAVLSRGLINFDQGSPEGWTPLMIAARGGHSRVAKVLLDSGADVSVTADNGVTALHVSAQSGHISGADLDARTREGATPLSLATQIGHSEVLTALIEAGADVNCGAVGGSTPLRLAAGLGNVAAVKELLRAKANPLLFMTMTRPSGETSLPLDAAAAGGHSKVVRALVQEVGIEGCGGESGGVVALVAAAEEGHVDILAILTGAGVIDTGKAVAAAAGCSCEASVKFLLEQRQRQRATSDGEVDHVKSYVNYRDSFGMTALFRSIHVLYDEEGGVLPLVSPKVSRLLVDVGADTASAVRVTDKEGKVDFYGTPLAFANRCLRLKGVRGIKYAREEQLHRLEAVHRLLMRVEAAHAVSWLWVTESPPISCGYEDSIRIARKTPANDGTQLTMMLPILRRRRRGVLLAPLLRWEGMCSVLIYVRT